jgi:hypothetical protein
MTDGYGAVLVDRPVESMQTEIAAACIFSDSAGKLAEAADPRFVVLAHPLENLILADTGYTWNDLFWQGRYVSVSNVVCRHCGHLFQHRRLDAGQPGCSAALALGLASGADAG